MYYALIACPQQISDTSTTLNAPFELLAALAKSMTYGIPKEFLVSSSLVIAGTSTYTTIQLSQCEVRTLENFFALRICREMRRTNKRRIEMLKQLIRVRCGSNVVCALPVVEEGKCMQGHRRLSLSICISFCL